MARKYYVGKGSPRPSSGGGGCGLMLLALPFYVANLIIGSTISLTKRPKGSACGLVLILTLSIYAGIGFGMYQVVT